MEYVSSLQWQQDIPVWKENEVLVIGGGPAGIASAVNAARHGAKTLLCEAQSYLGGMSTAGMVGPFMTCYDPRMEYQIIKGFFDEFVCRLEEDGGAIHPANIEAGSSYAAWRIRGHAHVTPFSSESIKSVAEEMCMEAGVELLYNAMFQYVIMDGERIEAAIFATKQGLMAVKAKTFVDCTGDADVAFRAGAPYEVGPENNGRPQPASMFFIIDGVDKEKLETRRAESEDISVMWFMDKVKEARERGEYPIPREKVAIYESVDGTFRVNMSRLNDFDYVDPESMTKAAIEGRRQVRIIFDFLRKNIPGCENIRLLESASVVGVRESRRIIGDFVLKGADMKLSTRHEDDVFLSGNRFDTHVGSRVIYENVVSGEPYGIPYRVFLPQKVENLLVAGRSVSGDQECISAIRVMPPCFAMGHAVGIAAAMTITDGVKPAQVDIQKLRETLKNENCVL